MPNSCPDCVGLREQVAALQAKVEQLTQLLDQSQRAAKRQAAPFAKGPPQEHPKKPGRKRGRHHGRHGHRSIPPPERIDETHEASLPDACPDCGGELHETHVDRQYQTEIPRRPVVRQFNIHCGQCQSCGQACQGRHPLQTSDAQSQLGPDAQAAIVYLNKQAGLSHGKVVHALHTLFGIELSRGASAQIVLRAGARLYVTAVIALGVLATTGLRRIADLLPRPPGRDHGREQPRSDGCADAAGAGSCS